MLIPPNLWNDTTIKARLFRMSHLTGRGSLDHSLPLIRRQQRQEPTTITISWKEYMVPEQMSTLPKALEGVNQLEVRNFKR
jgi:hypothetical protein